MADPTSSSSSPAPNEGEVQNLPIVHVRANSEQEMNELFAVVQNPGTHQVQLQRPLRLRNFPASFWTPPQTGGTKSPSCHSRENSLDNSLKDPFSPGAKSVGSPQPQQQGPQTQQAPQPQHNRSQSAPVELQQTLSVVQQQQQTQQHVHLRQPSYDVGTGTQANNNHLLGPLPPGWEPARTPTGQLYFMNHITKTTQWEDPRIQIQQQISRERQNNPVSMNVQRISPQPQNQQVSQTVPPPNINQLQGPQTAAVQSAIAADRQNLGPLPEGWEQSVTPEGETYFINHAAKETSWFDPRIPIQNQSVPIRNQNQVQLPGQQQQIMQQQNGPLAQGMTAMQKRQQEERLRRLENERRILQEKANKLQQFKLRQEQRLTTSQENMQAAVNATQEMLMRQNLNDAPNHGAPVTGMDAFLSTAQQVAAAQNEIHNRQESADSGLGMGSNFNLGSIPEDMSMDTDLDTTLTADSNNGPGSASNNCVVSNPQIGNVNSANSNGNNSAATKMDANELISTVLPGPGEIGLGDIDIMAAENMNMLNEEGTAPTLWL